MLSDAKARPQPADLDEGWLIEVSIVGLHLKVPARLLFAAAVRDEHQAASFVRKALGGLHCDIRPRCRFSPQALARMGVAPGQIKRLEG